MNFSQYIDDVALIGPELILCATILFVLLADLWRMGRDNGLVWVLAPALTIGCGFVMFRTAAAAGGLDIMPEFLGLVLAYGLVTIGDLYFRDRDDWVPGGIVLIGVALAAYRLSGLEAEAFGYLVPGTTPAFETQWGALIHFDGFSVVLRWIVLLTLGVTTIFAMLYRPFQEGAAKRGMPEFLCCLIGAHVGGMFLVQTTNVLFLFLALETLSLCSYMQAGMLKGDRRSGEAGLKYVLYGSVASGLLLFGFSLLYALTGELDLYVPASGVGDKAHGIMIALQSIVSGVNEGTLQPADVPASILAALGILGVIAGFSYKISAVPFHFWTADVYEGSPTPTTAFLSVGSKAVSFAVLLRFLTYLTGDANWVPKLVGFFAFLSAITMTYGNLAALRQSNLKRLIAFSSIAHAGYLLMGVVALFQLRLDPSGQVLGSTFHAEGYEAILFYLVAYALMNLGAFGVIIYLANRTGSEEIEDFRGLGWKAPWVGSAFVVFLLSLTGLPPTAGFFGKYYLLIAVIQTKFLWLAVLAIINTVISLFYYFRIAKSLFLRHGEEAMFETRPSYLLGACVLLLAALTLWIGIFPGATQDLAQLATSSLRVAP